MAKEVGAIRTKYVNVNLLFLKQVINISILASLGNLREPVSFFLRRLNRINWLQYSADSVLWSLCWDYTSEVTLKKVSIKKDEFGPSQELNKELWIVICLSSMSRVCLDRLRLRNWCLKMAIICWICRSFFFEFKICATNRWTTLVENENFKFFCNWSLQSSYVANIRFISLFLHTQWAVNSCECCFCQFSFLFELDKMSSQDNILSIQSLKDL